MTTTFNIPVTTRSNAISGQTVVPAGLHECSVVSNGEVFAVGRTLTTLIEVSFDGGATWKTEARAAGMRPSVIDPHLGLIVSFGNPEDPYPTNMRVTLTPVGGSITLGATVTIA